MPFSSDDLDAWLQAIRDGVVSAVESTGHPWRLPVLATIDEGRPRMRTVVLRQADSRLNLTLYTDARSRKVRDLQRTPHVEFLFYHPDWRVQLRVEAIAQMVVKPAREDAAWEDLTAEGRGAYRTLRAPGSPLEEPGDGQPEDPPPEAGRDHFTIIDARASRLDCLVLRPGGHRRAIWAWCEDAWVGSWVTP